MNKNFIFFHVMTTAVLVAAMFSSSTVRAKTLTVPDSVNRTIAKALSNASSGDTVIVNNGIYSENVLVKAGVTLKAKSLFNAIIKGNGKGCLVTMGGNSTISGFELRGGAIGIISKTSDNTISYCRITAMNENGISCVGQLPKIHNNIIVYNKGSGIQGWDVRSTFSSINHNTIAYNSNNGISIGGNSTVIIENNIIAFNERLGLKINEETVTVQIDRNDFFENSSMSYIVKMDNNSSADPMFVEPNKMNFQLKEDSQCKKRASDNKDIGALNEY
jgi:hypothetical protein